MRQSTPPGIAAHHLPLVDRLASGDGRAALTFAGQGTEVLPGLAALVDRNPELRRRIVVAADLLDGLVRSDLGAASGCFRYGYDLVAWVDDPTVAPPDPYIRSCAVSYPLVLLAQLLGWDDLCRRGFDRVVAADGLVAVTGHSQGLLAALAVAEAPSGPPSDHRLADYLEVAFHQGLHKSTAAAGMPDLRPGARPGPMAAVTGLGLPQLTDHVDRVNARLRPPHPVVVGLVNTPENLVVSGPVDGLELLRDDLRSAAPEARWSPLAVDVPFHSAALDGPARRHREWLLARPTWLPDGAGPALPVLSPVDGRDLGAVDGRAARTDAVVRSQFVEPVRWDRVGRALAATGADWILDLGPGTDVARFTTRNVRGTGTRSLALGSPDGLSTLTTPGAAPTGPDLDYHRFAPGLVRLPDGRERLDNRYVRATGQSPVVLPGMTPTTADAAIVAAAACAGFTAELAGGGQPTGRILDERLAELGELLAPDVGVVVNTLYMDRVRWREHIGEPVGTGRLFTAKRAGAPLVGVTVSAGIPDVDEAVRLLDALAAAGMVHNSFKPGTLEQVRQVTAIADAAAHHTVFVHLEGGKAGGHHSYEDLETLLMAAYHELRRRPNVVLAVGGGIGTPERAAAFLTGTWSSGREEPPMPVDAVLVGTAAMACAESTASPAVKQLLVEVPGTGDWVPPRGRAGGIYSGQSTFGADIHTVDNAAARCADLLAEVAGDAEAVAARRDEIVEALARTAKPYFGDLDRMTYAQVLRRFTELCAIGRHGRYEDGPWPDRSWRDRALALYRRWAARLAPEDRGTVVPPVAFAADLDDPDRALDRFVLAYPAADETLLHPADALDFVEVCDRPGKPVPFVAALDADVRRRYMADSLWQAQDPRYGADQVIVIPGPEAVAGIRRVDEPVAELLGRYEQVAVDRCRAAGVTPAARAHLRDGGLAPAPLAAAVLGRAGALADGCTAPLVDGAANPLWRLVRPGDEVEVVTDAADVPVRLVARPSGAPTEQVEVAVDDGAVDRPTVTVVVPSVDGPGATPRRTPVDQVFHPDAFRGGSGNGGPAGPGWEHRPEAAAAYRAFTGGGPEGTPLDWAFSLAWPALVGLLAGLGDVAGSDGAADAAGPRATGRPDLLARLVHRRHRVEAGPAWPPEAGAAGDAVVKVVRTEADAAGLHVDVVVELRGGQGPVAVVEAGLLLRGVAASTDRAARDQGRAGGEGGAGDEVSDSGVVRHDRPRRPGAEEEDDAPRDPVGFARVGGDHNPLHRSVLAARLAGLDGPVVHGMWTAARAAGVLVADAAEGDPSRLRDWEVRFAAPVVPGQRLRFSVARTGVRDGAAELEVVVRAVGDGPDEPVVAIGVGVVAPPRTALVFPGQGVQRAGLGREVRDRCAAARQVWERADAHARERWGFSLADVVDRNPRELAVGTGAAREVLRHPDGIVHRTEITQPALVALAAAQLAELRACGALPHDLVAAGTVVAGHSVGEISALSALDVLSLEQALEIAHQRGRAMTATLGRAREAGVRYGLAAVDPSVSGWGADRLEEVVAEVARARGELLEVVNHNGRGRQYVVAGTETTLADLARRAAAVRRLDHIDVPFHSSALKPAVEDLRATLDAIIGPVDHRRLVGRWVHNAGGALFRLDDPADVDSGNGEPGNGDPDDRARRLLIDLLARQVAGPVRWVDVQATLPTPVAVGGAGVRRHLEVGPAHAPVLSRLAAVNLAGRPDVEVLHTERDRERVQAFDRPTPDEGESGQPDDLGPPAPTPVEKGDAAGRAAPAEPAAPPDDRPIGPAEAVRALLAGQAGIDPRQLRDDETLDDLFQGVSSRRNQVLIDLGRELGLSGADGIHERTLSELEVDVESRVPGYRFPGPYLDEMVASGVRRALGSSGLSRADVVDRVRRRWRLGPGWVARVLLALALGSRPGESARGGALARDEAAPADAGAARRLIDRLVGEVADDLGVAVVPVEVVVPAPDGSTGPGAGRRDGAAAEPTGVPVDLSTTDEQRDRGRLAVLDRELGAGRADEVAGCFDPRQAVRFTTGWAAARWELTGLYHDASAGRGPVAALHGKAERLAAYRDDPAVAASARWFLDRARRRERDDVAALMARVLRPPTAHRTLGGVTALVTGAAPGSIAAALVARLLGRGAVVLATSSTATVERRRWYRDLYCSSAVPGAELHVVPANLASFGDIDALSEWAVSPESGSADLPTLVVPFAARPEMGDALDAGARSEPALRLQLLGVERLVAGIARSVGRRTGGRVTALLPLSPNQGQLGGDGPYGETKAGLEVLMAKGRSEGASWGRHARLVGARIGWVRSTGLTGPAEGGPVPGSPAAEVVSGMRTFSADEMGDLLLDACVRAWGSEEPGPLEVDLTGGTVPSGAGEHRGAGAGAPGWARPETAERHGAGDGADSDRDGHGDHGGRVAALPNPDRSTVPELPDPGRAAVGAADMVVIVGAGELGPCGTAATRFALEVGGRLPAAVVAELAWLCGLVRFERSGSGGRWVDAASGDGVDEADVADRYGDQVGRLVGVRPLEDDGVIDPSGLEVLSEVRSDREIRFEVGTEQEARGFVAADPEHTEVRRDPASGRLWVLRRAGAPVRVPRRVDHSRKVAGQFPTGLDLGRLGAPEDLAGSVDRMALVNLVCTAEAFRRAGVTPEELLAAVPPARVANTQGAGMGGMGSLRHLFRDRLLDGPRRHDRLQEALGNVTAAHVVQAFVGSYGPMVHPVAACATAAVSLEEAWDKIRSGKAEAVVAGGYDDLVPEGMAGFADMGATASSEDLAAVGLAPVEASRANDVRRCGFVEAQGGGAFLVVRGDVAQRLGLPVRGVLAYAGSFGDGIQAAIPAPGQGFLAAAGPLGSALRAHGLTADDVAVVSKHDTSTRLNDPHEGEAHQRLQEALGRTPGNPLLVVSQKTVTGHAKGGAAAWQVAGVLQMMEAGTVPGNRNLDAVDLRLRACDHLAHGHRTLRCAPDEPIRAALVTSLGFGHVSAVLALAHPGVFVAALPAEERAAYLSRAAGRRRRGDRDAAAVRWGEVPSLRRAGPFAADAAGRDAEAAMLLRGDTT